MGFRIPRALSPVDTLDVTGRMDMRRRAAGSGSYVPAAVLDDKGTIRSSNPAFARLLGYPPSELEGLAVGTLLRPDQRSRFRRARQRMLRADVAADAGALTLDWLDRNGRLVRSRAALRRGEYDGEICLRVESAEMRDDMSMPNEKARVPEVPASWLQSALDAVFGAVLLVDERGAIRFVNCAAERLLERPRSQLRGQAIDRVLGERSDFPASELSAGERVRQTLSEGGVQRLALWGLLENGRSVELVMQRLDETLERLALVEIVDVTEMRQREAQLRYLANFDPLTGLPNRELFMHRLAETVARGDAVTVGYVDVDRFKTLNEGLGHHAGDDVLCEVAERLKALVQQGDTVARLGGDEFGVLIGGSDTGQRAVALAEALPRALSESLYADGRELYLTACAGFAVAGLTGGLAEELLRNAEVALYASKQRGRSASTFYHTGLERDRADRLRLEVALRYALAEEQFTIYYQPVQRVDNGAVVGVEALIRWQHPERGLVSPGEFIPVLEETGLIRATGDWLLAEACRSVGGMRGSDGSPLALAVNVSADQVQDPHFADRVEHQLLATGFEPARLTLEITESLLMERSGVVLDALDRLERLGVRFAIDDFGTGYSSLAYLKRFPVRTLKIDRSFIAAIGDSNDDRTIVRTIVAMARSLGLEVVAEGVETAEQLEFLQRWSEVCVQGYLFAPPLPLPELRHLLGGEPAGIGGSG